MREFSVNAFNQHHGMQAVERFGLDTDPDQDGITNELTIGDITAASVFKRRCRYRLWCARIKTKGP